ncbi:probable G-protein coupled receptor Mth-like 10 [Nylanderia fulva]|uniref:probable G-protein coupled receptor Mth-like 10 n=1 Tax=Nylanderia fulva TaxID=613905 RepID=UPI0010FB68EA|nr:probable G-protein coupled receptor Mth-like 10 [Nylanderia fulva]
MSLEVFKNSSKDANETNIVPNEMCHNDTCIRLCCSLGERLVHGNCIPERVEYIFPNVYMNDSTQSEKRMNVLFELAINDSCREDYYLLSKSFQWDYKIFTNGSIYLPYYKIFVESTSYCLAVVDRNEFEVIICFKTYDKLKEILNKKRMALLTTIYQNITEISVYIIPILFLGSVFLVYSIMPELQNKHGFMLRNYSGAVSVVYGIDVVYFFIKSDIQYPVCVTIAFLKYFCYMASYFWLSIMSFDMWFTFRGFSSLVRNVRQQEKKKLIYYTIFAWGCPFMLAILCVSMDILSAYVNVPPILQPEFHLGDCWFFKIGPHLLYYYVLSSMCVINSICLSIYTALKIARFNKELNSCLKNSESKCFNDYKKWLNLYLQLFIVLFIAMGIEWLIITASLLYKNLSIYNIIWYVVNFMGIMQSLCIFVIFVCKKRIKRMLFKRFGFGLSSNA